MSSTLELVLRRKLQDAGRYVGLNQAERCRMQVVHRVDEVDVIQSVEEFKAQFHPLMLADPEKPGQV